MDGEFSLIVGYRENGDTLVCRTYAGHQGAGYEERPLKEVRGMLGEAWYVEALRPRGSVVIGPRDHTASLRFAVELANRGRSKSYACGFKAYETWIRGIRSNPVQFEHLQCGRRGVACLVVLGNGQVIGSVT